MTTSRVQIWKLVCMCAVALPVLMPAQTVKGPVLTAAFLINFAKYTGWPEDRLATNAPLTLCALDSAVGDALTVATRDQVIDAHPLGAAHVGVTPPPRQCHVLYASGLDGSRIDRLVASLEGASVLLVGDSDQYTKRGATMHLFVQDGTTKFAVNVDAAERERLRLSSRLLSLATIVRARS